MLWYRRVWQACNLAQMQLPKIKADGAIDDHDVYFLGDDGLKAGEGDDYRQITGTMATDCGLGAGIKCTCAHTQASLTSCVMEVYSRTPLPPHTQFGETSERAIYLGCRTAVPGS